RRRPARHDSPLTARLGSRTLEMERDMADLLSLDVRLTCFLQRRGGLWGAGCPALDVHSQGPSETEARRFLEEAVRLWIESCVERGTLEQALRELGWEPSPGIYEPGALARSQVAEPGAAPDTIFELRIPLPIY